MNNLGFKNWTICVLAGGQSKRMGRDKSRIQIRGRSLLQRVKSIAQSVCEDVLTVRSDAVPNCGPLSGILTGLQRARTPWCLFVGCDMPLISRQSLADVISKAECSQFATFVKTDRGIGFPFALHTNEATRIERMIADGQRSLRELAAELKPIHIELPESRRHELFNANTPEDLKRLRELINSRETE